MKNFVFISPNFPETYWQFCAALKRAGFRVLGVGDQPYDQLMQELRDSLDEYYKVSNPTISPTSNNPFLGVVTLKNSMW